MLCSEVPKSPSNKASTKPSPGSAPNPPWPPAKPATHSHHSSGSSFTIQNSSLNTVRRAGLPPTTPPPPDPPPLPDIPTFLRILEYCPARHAGAPRPAFFLLQCLIHLASNAPQIPTADIPTFLRMLECGLETRPSLGMTQASLSRKDRMCRACSVMACRTSRPSYRLRSRPAIARRRKCSLAVFISICSFSEISLTHISG